MFVCMNSVCGVYKVCAFTLYLRKYSVSGREQRDGSSHITEGWTSEET